MNKIIISIAAAVAALFAVSCVKETPMDDAPVQGTIRTVKITASVDQMTKTSYDADGKFSWKKGDRISVYCSDGQFHEFTAMEDGKTVSFEGQLGADVNLGWCAFFPADQNHNVVEGDYYFNYPMYKDLTVDNSADIPMGATYEEGTYVFKHMSGAALLTFTNIPDDVVAVEISVKNSAHVLSGSFITYSNDPWSWVYAGATTEEEKTWVRKVSVEKNQAQVYLPFEGEMWSTNTVDIIGFDEDENERVLLQNKTMKGGAKVFEEGVVIPFTPLELEAVVVPSDKLDATDLPELDWASAASAVNDESATSDFKMKEIRAFVDANYLYVRVATAQGLPLEADYLDIDFCDGDGPNKVWSNWTTTGTNVYWAEHKGSVAADGTLAGMSFGSAEVICYTEVAEESVIWYLAYPRESVEQYVSAKGKIYVSALLWNGWSNYWAVPARGKEMLKVDVFEDPNSLKNVDWNAADVVSYDLPEGASSDRQSLRSVKYFADAENIKVRLVASAEKLAEQVDGVPTTHLGVFLYDVVNGSGDGYYGWWNNAAGNNEYEGEHVGVITGTDLSLSINDVNVEVTKVVEGDDVVWMFAIPRSAHENLAANEVNMAFIAYRNWGQTGALPDKYDDMFKVTLP